MKTLLPKFALLAVVVLAAAGTAGASSTAAQPHWQKLPASYNAEGGFYRSIGYASGRVWFAVGVNSFTIWSARVQSGRLTSFVSTPEPENVAVDSGVGALGESSLLFCCNQRSDGTKASMEAPLLSNGKVGTPRPIPGDPELVAAQKVVPTAAFNGSTASTAQSEVTIGNRPVWVINGYYCTSTGPARCKDNDKGGVKTFAVCCNASGEAVDLTPLLADRTKQGASLPRLMLDSHRRLWLGWAEAPLGPPNDPSALHLTQLDPSTLAVRASKTLRTVVFPSEPIDHTIQMACSDSCRLLWTNRTGVFAWGGDGPPTRVLGQGKFGSTGLGGARYRGAQLEVASFGDKTDQGPDYGTRVTVARGDARGRNSHVVSFADVPQGKYSGNSVEEVLAFTPAGAVAVAGYMGTPSYLLATVVPG